MMLIGNSCLAELFFGSNMLATAIFMYQNDSYLILAVYRYITVVYQNPVFWRSARFQLILIGCVWMFGFLCLLLHWLTDQIQYRMDDQICQGELRFSISVIYIAMCVYVIPISTVVFVYYELVRYVKRTNRNATIAHTVLRAERELKMVRQIVILISGLTILGLPYAIFTFVAFFTPPSRCHDLSVDNHRAIESVSVQKKSNSSNYSKTSVRIS